MDNPFFPHLKGEQAKNLYRGTRTRPGQLDPEATQRHNPRPCWFRYTPADAWKRGWWWTWTTSGNTSEGIEPRAIVEDMAGNVSTPPAYRVKFGDHDDEQWYEHGPEYVK